tara:strand:+ start:136971 stop:137309 length:339 start_codon:yes stop_codon:yes gene_type:complete
MIIGFISLLALSSVNINAKKEAADNDLLKAIIDKLNEGQLKLLEDLNKENIVYAEDFFGVTLPPLHDIRELTQYSLIHSYNKSKHGFNELCILPRGEELLKLQKQSIISKQA